MKKHVKPNGVSHKYVPVRIRVTANDLCEGRQGDENSCPIARALNRITTRNARVFGNTIAVGDTRFRAPQWVEKFVEHYDDSLSPATSMIPRRKTVYLPAKFLKRFQTVS